MPRKKITLGQFLATVSGSVDFSVYWEFDSFSQPTRGGYACSWSDLKSSKATLRAQDELGSGEKAELLISDYVVTRIGFNSVANMLYIDVEKRQSNNG